MNLWSYGGQSSSKLIQYISIQNSLRIPLTLTLGLVVVSLLLWPAGLKKKTKKKKINCAVLARLLNLLRLHGDRSWYPTGHATTTELTIFDTFVGQGNWEQTA
ncbi:predicted protein [Histoplasma capsulatum var. duboisii H88]|uniref:Predicted protein n=2 Tax=Ajellomyces capsulatus TaxID=5037 RepID=F0UNK3_AJEC8|nr:predicted protein [Histoplasma capsulatum H143]EGC47608.1 predicted protein [Histoplasma capsulatum var. duboisii H88]